MTTGSRLKNKLSERALFLAADSTGPLLILPGYLGLRLLLFSVELLVSTRNFSAQEMWEDEASVE